MCTHFQLNTISKRFLCHLPPFLGFVFPFAAAVLLPEYEIAWSLLSG